MSGSATQRASVVVIGKESSGKSQLIASLTGQWAYTANYRGSTVACDIFPADNVDLVDTPGILLKSDSVTTALALDKLQESEKVLLVVKAPDLANDLEELLPLLKGKRAIGVVTFWDKVPQDGQSSEALEQIGRDIDLFLIPVDSRHLTENQRMAITTALDQDARLPIANRAIQTPWSVRPRLTLLEDRRFGALWGMFLLLAPAVIAVWSANNFADWLDPWIQAAVKRCVDWFAILPSPLKDVAIGKYGVITMGPLLFVWAVPTVLVYALVVGVYKASGLLDRITVALHPAVHRIGITGRDLVRIVMGFGCNVPAVINSRCCSRATRDSTISAIAFGAACSYQFGATLSVFAAVSRPYLAVPFLVYLVITTVIYMRLMTTRVSRTPFLVLSMDKPTFLEWPRASAIWAEARGSIVQFFRRSMPIFLGITIAASLLEWMGVIARAATWIEPAMAAFHLPKETAVVVVFSCIRKDAILLLSDGPGFSNLRNGQILTAVYLAGVLMPCLVTALTISYEKSMRFALVLVVRQGAAALVFSLILAWFANLFGI